MVGLYLQPNFEYMKWLNFIIKYRPWLGILFLSSAVIVNIQAGFWPSFILYLIGVSRANLLTADDVRNMATDPLILALANPTPEIMPEAAYKGGALVVGTGRSDLPNQVNNVLAFPGIFLGALQGMAKQITLAMKFAAAEAIASCVTDIRPDQIIPHALDESVAIKVAEAVKKLC